MQPNQLPIPNGTEFNPLLLFPEGIDINEWMFETILPFINGRTIEIDSGNDSIISCFLKSDLSLHLSNNETDICKHLYGKYKDNPLIRSVQKINFDRIDFESVYADVLGRFKTVFKLSTTKKIPISKTIISNAALLLKPGGCLMILTPVYTALYAGMESDPMAIRNHNRSFTRAIFGKSFEIQKTQYLNLPPIGSTDESNLTGLSVIIIAKKL